MTEANDNASGKRRKAISDIRDALRNESSPAPRRRRSPVGHTVTGDGNVIGNGNTVTHYHEPAVVQRKTYVKTGDGVLDAAQKAKINALIKEWAATRDAVRKSKAEISTLRYAFNTYMNVNSYHEIKQEDFDKALRWLYRQTGIINSMPSAATKNPNWRNKRYASIKAKCRDLEGGLDRQKIYIKEKYGANSLTELADEQLEASYHHIRRWR